MPETTDKKSEEPGRLAKIFGKEEKKEETYFEGMKKGISNVGDKIGEGAEDAYHKIGDLITPGPPPPTGMEKVKEGLGQVVHPPDLE